MHRSIASIITNKTFQRHQQLQNHLVLRPNPTMILEPPCQAFINHRGADTKRNVAGLVHHYLRLHGFHPFLDCQTMKPGEKLHDRINDAIHECKVGIAVFSPRYCESPYCLHELALLTETRKRLIPIFCDVRPSQLKVLDYGGGCSARHAKRFRSALDEAKSTVGLTFDSATGDWSKLLRDTFDAVLRVFYELEQDQDQDKKWHNQTPPNYIPSTVVATAVSA